MTEKGLPERTEQKAGEKREGRSPGRPKTVGNEGTVTPAYLYMTEELIAEIDAVRGGKSRSQWVREAIREKLAGGKEEARGR